MHLHVRNFERYGIFKTGMTESVKRAHKGYIHCWLSVGVLYDHLIPITQSKFLHRHPRSSNCSLWVTQQTGRDYIEAGSWNNCPKSKQTMHPLTSEPGPSRHSWLSLQLSGWFGEYQCMAVNMVSSSPWKMQSVHCSSGGLTMGWQKMRVIWCVCACTCALALVCVCLCMHVHTNVYVCMYIYVYLCLYMGIFRFIYVCLCLYMYIQVYTYVCLHVSSHVYIRI